MLHQIHRQSLTKRERQILTALAEVTLPGGRILPAAGPATIRRVEAILATFPTHLQRAYKAMLLGLESYALVARRRRFTQLSAADRRALVEGWLRGGVARRLSARGLLAPLKIAHFDNPSLYREIGCVYEFEPSRGEARPRYMRERVHGPDDVDQIPVLSPRGLPRR